MQAPNLNVGDSERKKDKRRRHIKKKLYDISVYIYLYGRNDTDLDETRRSVDSYIDIHSSW